MNRLFLSIALCSSIAAGCSHSSEVKDPEWIDMLIEKFKSEPVGNPPQAIWRYTYHGQTVYFVPPQCCDMFSDLYDRNGTRLCGPDGGITGTGDGRCTDFFSTRSDEELVWRDPRTR